MAFANTVETVGDAALTRSIIDRSITELNCNITTSIRQYAFQSCTALKSVNFPSVTSVALGAFRNCSALEKAEFGAAADFGNNAFYGCSKLGTVILRSADQLCTLTGTPFANTPIASGTGYIYVPAALVDQYKASWTAYAAQIRAIEDYPGIADPYSWAGVAANIADGSYKNVYKIGDLMPLDMGSEGQINMQVAAIDADDLADGSGKAPISWVSKELLKTSHRMNPALVTNDDGTYQEGTGGIGGWASSELRTYMSGTILPIIPSEVRNMIKSVTKPSGIYDTSGEKITSYVTEDTVWIPSHFEIGNGNIYETGIVYSVLDTSTERKRYIVGTTTSKEWWLRSASNTSDFRAIMTGGSVFAKSSDSTRYIVLGFCT